MTAIENSDWVWEFAGTPIDVMFAVPRMPACKHWQDISVEPTNMKYGLRAFRTSTGDEVMHLMLTLTNEGSTASYPLADNTPTPKWDRAVTAALTIPEYPVDADRPDNLAYKKAVPYYLGVCKTYKSGSALDSTSVYGYELQARHDSTTYDGENVELFDYSGATFCAEDCPASSFLLTRMVAEAMNCITFNAGFRICVAIASSRVA